VQWAGGALKNPDTLIKGGDSLRLDAINENTDHGKQILASARRILTHLGQPDGAPVTLAQAMVANSVFASALFNGDGVIVAQCADDPALAAVIGEIAECVGAVGDRSGKPGIDQDRRADKFFEACAAFDGWMKQAEADARSIMPAGANTAAAAAAVQADQTEGGRLFWPLPRGGVRSASARYSQSEQGRIHPDCRASTDH
jgi:hypothetical protein